MKRDVTGMKYISCIILAVLSSAATVWLIVGGTLTGPSKSIASPTLDISYSDFISLLLTVLAVILAALALGIGLIAFRTIGEIKREASQIAQSEVEQSLSDVPETVSRNVEQAVAELLPKAIDQAVEDAGKAGRLDEALERAIIRASTGGTDPELERQPDSGTQSEREENDA